MLETRTRASDAWWDSEWWKRLAVHFWYFRGIAAAIAIANLVPLVFDLSRWEFLRAFYAVVLGWNRIAAWIGTLVDLIPFLPPLSAAFVNALILVSALVVPGLTAMYVWSEAHRWVTFSVGLGIALLSGVLIVVIALEFSSYPLVPIAGLGLGVSGMLCGRLAPNTKWTSTYWIVAATCLSLVTLDLANSAGESGWSLSLLLCFSSVFALACIMLAGYWRGAVTVVTFVGALTLLYYANTPWVTEQVNSLAASALNERTHAKPSQGSPVPP